MADERNDINDLRGMSDAALLQALDEARQDLFNRRFQYASGQSDKSAGLREGRRSVARLLTLKREREIAAAEAQQGVAQEAGKA
jgi:large subunit ribosomal protein L29